MKFVDKCSITVKAGDGGPGITSFRREKYVPLGGPDGGHGGDGGHVIIRGNHNKQTLLDITIKKIYKAKNGEAGRPKNQHGANGEDTVIDVPLGTIITQPNALTPLADITYDNQEIIVARGGKGGKGNAAFKSSTNRAPRYAQKGLPGEEKELTLELKLIAQVGLVGLPNAGKSTLLKLLTHANPKIANYPFTTLVPNLGVLRTHNREIVIADIPGLIEGASQGHGLGHDFLRHIERTQKMLHLVDISFKSPEECWNNFTIVKNELINGGVHLESKPCTVILTKTDSCDDAHIYNAKVLFETQGYPVLCISSITKIGINELIQHIVDTVS